MDSSGMAQRGKNLPAMQETWVQSPGREDPLEKEMTTHSSIRAWRIPGTEEPGRLQSMGFAESDTSNYHFQFFTYMGPPGKISMQLEIFKATPGTSLVGPAMECLPANAGDKGLIPGPGGFHQPQGS